MATGMSLTSSLGCALALALIGVHGCPAAPRDPDAESAPPVRVPLTAPPGDIGAAPPARPGDSAASLPKRTAPPPRIVSPFPPPGAEDTPFGARIGMPIERFQKIFPADRFPELAVSRPDAQVGIHAMVHGLDGGWTYSFAEGKLKWAMFNRYIDELTQANFDRCLAATDAIIADYRARYGAPIALKTGERTFKDPRVEHHWGYEVMQATWKSDGMKFDVDFDFMGGKGEYHLLVQTRFGREDSPDF